MSAAREKGPRARLLYAPGARPTDPTPKAGQRFDAIYAMPSSLAPRPYRWTRPAAAPKTVVVASARTSRSSSAAVRTESSAPLDPALFDRGAFSAISLPDHGLRDRARQALKHSVEPTRGAMPAPTLARSFPDLRLPVPETATSPEAHAAPAPISGELPPAAIVESPSEIRNVVKDPDVRARARLALRPDEHVRPTGRPPIRPEATAFPKLPEPTLEVRYERPKLTSPPERPAGELPPLPTSVKAPKNRCECRQEWGAWRNQERYLLCVLRKEGSPLLWTMSYLDDAGCRQSCHTMWTDSRSSICYR